MSGYPDNRLPLEERPLPRAVEAEATLLGAINRNNALIAQAIDLLDVDDFYVPAHRRIHQAQRDLFSEGKDIQPVLIADKLGEEGTLEMAGGLAFIIGLEAGVPHMDSVVSYAEIVKQKALGRAVYRTAVKIAEEALEQEDPARVVLDRAQDAILSLEQFRSGRTVESIHHVAATARESLEALRRGENPAVPSPWNRLNGMTRGGIHKTELWGCSAIVKQGKSSFLKQWAQLLNQNKVRALFFSREMSAVEIMYRMLAPGTGIPVSQIRYGLDTDRIDRLIEETRRIEKGDSLFFDTKTSSVIDMRTRVREMIRLEGIEVVFWDYAQCFKAGKKTYSRADEVAAVWRGMKDTCQDFNLAGCAVAQFNRESFKGDERPKFHQTEGSGEAEKAVSVGLVLSTDFHKGVAGARPATFFIDYQRNESAGGEVPLLFNGRIMEFHEVSDPHEPVGAVQSELALDLNS